MIVVYFPPNTHISLTIITSKTIIFLRFYQRKRRIINITKYCDAPFEPHRTNSFRKLNKLEEAAMAFKNKKEKKIKD